LHDASYGQYSFNFNYSNRDETPFTDNNLGFINQQDRIHASINLAFKESDINVSLYGKNLTDKVLYE